MSFDDMLLGALRDSQRPPQTQTRLATVVGYDATTVAVRFDGESAMSPRSYPLTFGPVRSGDRIVMLRAGSSWVAVGRVSTAAKPADSGRVTVVPGTNVGNAPYGVVSAVHLRNGWVHLNLEAQVSANIAATTNMFVFPVEYAPAERVWINCGSPFAANRNYSLSITPAGFINNQHLIPNTEVLLGHASWPASG